MYTVPGCLLDHASVSVFVLRPRYNPLIFHRRHGGGAAGACRAVDHAESPARDQDGGECPGIRRLIWLFGRWGPAVDLRADRKSADLALSSAIERVKAEDPEEKMRERAALSNAREI